MKNRQDFQRLTVPDGSSAHPAGFEPTACRLGDQKGGISRSSAEVCQHPGRLDF